MIDREILSKRLNEAYQILLKRGVVHSKSDLAKAINKAPRSLISAFSNSGRVMTVGLLERVADAFPEILNRQWLVEGVGEPERPDASLRPMVEAKAAAGFMDGISSGETGVLTDVRSFFPPHDFMIAAEGDSMEPEIESGDMLLCRHADDPQNLPLGEICVIDTKDGALVKVIKEISPDGESVRIHSLNPEYPDRDIDSSEILGIARVVALVRPNI